MIGRFYLELYCLGHNKILNRKLKISKRRKFSGKCNVLFSVRTNSRR